jgi:hypothetical protein
MRSMTDLIAFVLFLSSTLHMHLAIGFSESAKDLK